MDSPNIGMEKRGKVGPSNKINFEADGEDFAGEEML